VREILLAHGRVRVVQTERADGDVGQGWEELAALGWQQRPVWVRQVHGSAVVEAACVSSQTEADAIVRRSGSELVAGVRTADCVPVALVAENGDAAVVHAGWPGITKGVVAAAGRALGVHARWAVIGAHARACCYEFLGEPERAAVRAAIGDGYFRGAMLDLTAAVRDQLAALGVEQIVDLGGCTIHEPWWFSWRAEGTAARQALLVGPAR